MTLTTAQLQEIRERDRLDEIQGTWSGVTAWGRWDLARRDRLALLSHIADLEQREQRAVEALRKEVMPLPYRCNLCMGFSRAGLEHHNPITLSGVTGPCPAELRKPDS